MIQPSLNDWLKQKALLEKIDDELVKEWDTALKAARKEVLSELSSTTDKKVRARLRAVNAKINEAIGGMDMSDETLAGLSKTLFNSLSTMLDVDVDFVSIPAVAVNAILDRNAVISVLGYSINDLINDTKVIAARRFRSAVASGLVQGKSIDQIAVTLGAVATNLSSRQVTTVARTIVSEVQNRSNMEIYDREPMVIGYQYLAKLDKRTSDTCRHADGERRLKANGHTSTTLKDSGWWPPRHFNCRSVVIPILSKENE